MVHYKVSFDVWRQAGLREDGFHTFCGLDVRTMPTSEGIHWLGNPMVIVGPPVTCPKCKLLFDTVVNHYLQDKNP